MHENYEMLSHTEMSTVENWKGKRHNMGHSFLINLKLKSGVKNLEVINDMLWYLIFCSGLLWYYSYYIKWAYSGSILSWQYKEREYSL
jgi:hypothetical protein